MIETPVRSSRARYEATDVQSGVTPSSRYSFLRSSTPTPARGAAEEPQFPASSVVTPCRTRLSAVGYSRMPPSEWLWMSTKPGQTWRPAASRTRRPWSAAIEPTAAMASPFRATSAAYDGRAGAVHHRPAADHDVEGGSGGHARADGGARGRGEGRLQESSPAHRVLPDLRPGTGRGSRLREAGPSSTRPGGVEARPVARAVPAPLGAVPAHDAAHVRAHRGHRAQRARVVARDRDPLAVHHEHAPAPARHVGDRAPLRPLQAIADEVGREVDVLLQERARGLRRLQPRRSRRARPTGSPGRARRRRARGRRPCRRSCRSR